MIVEIFDKGFIKDDKENITYIRESCRAIVLHNHSILLMHNIGKDHFMLPGGGVENNETLFDCVKREVLEETAILVEPSEKPFITIKEYFQNECYINHYFTANVVETGLKRRLTQEEIEDGLQMNFIHQNDIIGFLNYYHSDYRYVMNVHNREIIAIKKYLEMTNKAEMWNVYDEFGNLTNKVVIRGSSLSPGEFHKVVHIWIKNSAGEYLIQKRSPNKTLPNLWAITGGSLTVDDADGLIGAIREVKEELGIDLDKQNARKLDIVFRENCIYEIWLFTQDVDISKCILQLDEVVDVCYVSKSKMQEMYNNGSFYNSINVMDLI